MLGKIRAFTCRVQAKRKYQLIHRDQSNPHQSTLAGVRHGQRSGLPLSSHHQSSLQDMLAGHPRVWDFLRWACLLGEVGLVEGEGDSY